MSDIPLPPQWGLFPLYKQQGQEPKMELEYTRLIFTYILTYWPTSIIAVHGLRGDKLKSWSHPYLADWLKDLLPIDIPLANVFTYGYRDGNSVDSIARDLIGSLENERLNRPHYDTPIVFLAKGTGGLIVKQVCKFPTNFRPMELDTLRLLYCWLPSGYSL
jgi:hypothetical protein